MLALKDSPLLNRGRKDPTTRTASILSLPLELLTLIAENLYYSNARNGRIYNILAASRTCRAFRKATLPLLFETVSCVVREHVRDQPHPSFDRMVQHPELLCHVRVLSLRFSLRDNAVEGDVVLLESRSGGAQHATTTAPSNDGRGNLDTIKAAIQCMPGLQQLRYRGPWETLFHLLLVLRDRQDIYVVVEFITPGSRSGLSRASSQWQEDFLLSNFNNVALGRRAELLSTREDDHRQTGNWAYVARHIHAVWLSYRSPSHTNHFDPSIELSAVLADASAAPSPLPLEELHLDIECKSNPDAIVEPVSEDWVRNVHHIISTSHLRRLSIGGNEWIFGHVFVLQLPHLESLRIQISYTWRGESHTCGWNSQTLTDEGNDALFKIDYGCLPRLRSVHIEGICNHITIEHLAGPTLTSLKLHSHVDRASVYPQVSQRSPADILTMARLAPQLRCLQLDIGDISKLWHPTAIPMVDVNVELYSFLMALSDFKKLRTLRLFPPYISSNVFTLQGPNQQQPISDNDAIAMFLRLRSQIPTLENFAISPSDYNFYGEVDPRVSRRTSYGRQHDFQAMAWDIYSCGDSIILNTRQARKKFSQRQVWVGNRKLRSEIRRDAYAIRDNDTAGGALPDDEPWILDPVTSF